MSETLTITTAAPSVRCSYCNREPYQGNPVLQWENLDGKKRERFLIAKGRFPVCHHCRILVLAGRQPMEKPLIKLLQDKAALANAQKHKTAKPTDIPALRALAKEAEGFVSAVELCEKELLRQIDELPSLPSKLANPRANTCIRNVRRLNSINEHIRQINAYVSQHIVIDYSEARRAANNAVRPEWVRLNVMRASLGKCHYCASTEDLSIDHALPVFRGGDSTPKNLQMLCRKCNSAKGMVDRHLPT